MTAGKQPSAAQCFIEQVVSGGQTGVDRAALDAAIEVNVAIGGWCPRGRRSEGGPIPARYPLRETAERSYAVRTKQNVIDSDGTLIVVLDEITSGTKLTLDIARRHHKPVTVIHLEPESERSLYSDENSVSHHVGTVVDWLRRHKIRVLNVAGPRESSDRTIYIKAKGFVRRLLTDAVVCE